MTASPSFLLLSIIRTIRAGKRTAVFLILGHTVGLLLPTAILGAARHELHALHGGTMTEADRIIRLEERAQAAPPNVRSDAQPSDAEWLDILRNLDPSVESVSRMSEHAGILSDGRAYRYAYILSVDPSYPGLFRHFISRGGELRATGGRECAVGTGLAREMWGGSGIGKEIRAGSVKCTVTGETDIHDRRVIVVDPGREHFRGRTTFFVKVKDPGAASAVLGKIEALGGPWKAEPMTVVQRREIRQAYAVYSGAVLVSLITLLYALLNIGAILALMFRERSRKYGIQSAIGAGPRTLRAEFAGEMLLVTIVSMALAFGALKTGQPLVERHLFSMRLDPSVLLSAALLNLLICGTAGILHERRIRKAGIIRLIREADG